MSGKTWLFYSALETEFLGVGRKRCFRNLAGTCPHLSHDLSTANHRELVKEVSAVEVFGGSRVAAGRLKLGIAEPSYPAG